MKEFKKLSKQPLRFVLAEFRFSAILKIQSFIPDIQERLRKKFPTVQEKEEVQIIASPNGLKHKPQNQWIFTSPDRKSAVHVSQDRMYYSTSDYDRFDGFSDNCAEVLLIFIDILSPSLLTRVGLRYGDLITKEGDIPISKLVSPQYIPSDGLETLKANVESTIQQTTETIAQTKDGLLVARGIYGRHNMAVWPDTELAIKIENPKPDGPRLILDFDHFWQPQDDQPPAFELNTIISILNSLHENSREAFGKVTTEYARDKVWL